VAERGSGGRTARFTAVVGETNRQVVVTTLGDGRFEVAIDGTPRIVEGRPIGTHGWSLLVDGVVHEVSVLAKADAWAVQVGGRTHRLKLLDERAMRARTRGAAGSGEREVRAAMPGKVVALLTEVGAEVTQGQGLLVIEAMKMENEVGSPRAGTVKEIRVKPGQAVEAGELLAVVE
jgi:biotin carboxyl carrier protein